MDSQSISMDMVGRDDLEELAPFITNEDVVAAALCDAYGELWLGSETRPSGSSATPMHTTIAFRLIEVRGLKAGGSCGLGGYKASSQQFYLIGCMRLVPVFFRAHLAADSPFLCGIVLAGGPDNFLLLLVLTVVGDESFWRFLCVAHHGAPVRGV
jgi:hypothetical protein